jgi:hypothetical protein
MRRGCFDVSVGVVGVRVGGLRVAVVVGGCLVAVLAAWTLWGSGRGAAPSVGNRVGAVPEAARGVVSRTWVERIAGSSFAG